MIRRLVLLCALGLVIAFSVRLYGDTRYALRAAEPVAATLGGEEPLSGAIVFVFQPEDCFGSGGLLQRWNALRQKTNVPVLGRVVGRGALSPRQQALFDSLRVEIPIRGIDPLDAGIVAEKLGYRSTPFAVVLDRRGRVAASFPAGQNVPPEILERFVRGS
ncbi:MAG TPA: hypothetical protein VF746_15480 [Longimicrobium sp.]|jgi:hypothetical protein